MLQTDQGGISDIFFLLSFGQIKIDLSGTEQYLDHLLRFGDESIVDHFLKTSRHEFGFRGISTRVAKIRLGRKIHQWFTEGPCELTTQGMEKVGGRGNIGDHHIQFGTHLQKTFHPRTGVFGSLAFISMGQQQGDPIHPVPFLLAGRYELVDHGLCAIAEIAKLGFPQYKCVGIGHGVSIFKSQYPIFTQQ